MDKKKNIVIIGAGGFGREVYYLLDKHIYNCVGFIDFDKTEKLPAQIIGRESEMDRLINNFKISDCIIAVGDQEKRKIIYNKIKNFPLEFPTIIDSSARCLSEHFKKGTIIYPSVVVMNDSKIGEFSLLNSGVTIGHDVNIGNYCNINPGSSLAGKITIGDGSFVGIGTSIKEEIIIGKNVTIGAGSVVINNVKDNETVYGVPAKVRK